MLFSAIIALNVLSAWYLSRLAFRRFAVQFSAEREKEKLSYECRRFLRRRFVITSRANHVLHSMPGGCAAFIPSVFGPARVSTTVRGSCEGSGLHGAFKAPNL